ncbi:MAG: N-acetyltransferase [Phycisphaeraceae bacterium]|nr:MAG: N-acetyltransferase [Phycisphaeraceae bacterium]
MAQRPTLTTDRLILRPFELSDAGNAQRLAGDKKVAATTLSIPHPYPDGAAEEWIGTHQAAFDEGNGVEFAITDRESGELIGSIGLRISREHAHAELGYWIGVPHWGNGYATEAGRAVIDYGFRELSLRRIHAHHAPRNPASGRVLEKLGMRPEGVMREHIFKWGEFEDCVLYGLLRSEYDSDSASAARR